MIEADKKRDQILEKAVMRFAHFGIQKTTMNEIADDLSMSKPSVYYYFPDKISLVMAVINRIISEYQDRLAELFSRSENLHDAIFSMLDLRREFFQKYFMLHLGDQVDLHLAKQEFRESIIEIRNKEIELVREVFERAVKSGSIKIEDATDTAALFLDTLAGINICVMGRQERQLVPDNKGFDEVLAKQKQLAEIFLRGLE